jgi:hypothetical protein
VRLEAGIEIATYRLVALCLNKLRYRGYFFPELLANSSSKLIFRRYINHENSWSPDRKVTTLQEFIMNINVCASECGRKEGNGPDCHACGRQGNVA